jgi:hypothetical protein
MDTGEFNEGLAHLDELAKKEYRQSVYEVAAAGNDAVMTRVGRLIGVMLKEPFATPTQRTEPSEVTRAYRNWELREHLDYSDPGLQRTWQYKTLLAIVQDQSFRAESNWFPNSVESLVTDAQFERGFFSYLARSTRHYLCNDAAARKDLQKRVDEARRLGSSVSVLTPSALAGAGAVEIANALTHYAPNLGFAEASIIAGLTFVIYSIGTDAFCQWARDRETRDLEQR